jgi:hypothetical protein
MDQSRGRFFHDSFHQESVRHSDRQVNFVSRNKRNTSNAYADHHFTPVIDVTEWDRMLLSLLLLLFTAEQESSTL